MQRTSLSHPLQIAELSVGTAGGAIGVTFAPGKCQQMAMTGSWDRDLDIDLRSIVVWGAEYLLSLLEPWEFEELHIQELPQRAKALGLNWHGLPIIDGAAPDSRFMSAWESTGSLLSNELLQGRKAVVHCKGALAGPGLWQRCCFCRLAQHRVRSKRLLECDRFVLGRWKQWSRRTLS